MGAFVNGRTWLRVRLRGRLPPALRDVVVLGGADLSGANLVDVDLSGADLEGADLSDADLWGIDLAGADLRGVDLSDADLWDAGLSGADLRGSDLSGAHLEGADLSGTILRRADLSGADLRRADLSHASLLEADLPSADLRGASFRGANLRRADLSGANLLEADLSSADLSVAKLTGADLLGADLSRATIVRADLSDATFGVASRTEAAFGGGYERDRSDIVGRFLDPPDAGEGSHDGPDSTDGALPRTRLTGVELLGANLSGVDLSYTDLGGASVRGAVVTDTDLTEAKLDGTDFGFTDLSGESFREVDFSRADLKGVDLSGTDLVGAVFVDADLRGAVFDQAECRRCTFDGADLERVSFIGCDLRSAGFEDAKIYRANFSGCRLGPDTTIQAVRTYAAPTPLRDRLVGRMENSYGRARERLSGGSRSGVGKPSGSGRPAVRPDPDPGETGDRDEASGSGTDGEAGGPPSDDPDEPVEATPRDAEPGGRSSGPGIDDHSGQGDGGDRRRIPDGEYTPSERFERAAWTYSTIHRLLTRHDRTSEALDRRYYRDEQWARIRQAQADRNVVRLVRVLLGYVLIRISERLWSVGVTILFVTTLFSVVYWAVGGVTPEVDGAAGSVRLFLFSLVTLLGGIHSVLDQAIPFGVVAELDPLFEIVLGFLGVAELEPATDAGDRVAAIEHGLGVLLIVPFALLSVQRLRLYARAATTEGTGGLTSWLFGK